MPAAPSPPPRPVLVKRKTITSEAFNFGPASMEESEWVFGAARPGGPQSDGECKIQAVDAEVVAWIDYARTLGVKHVVSLLKDEELAQYASPGYATLMRSAGFTVTTTELTDTDAIKGALTAARKAGEKLLFHCVGGEHRTGNALAYALTQRGLAADVACETVNGASKSLGVSRHADAKRVSLMRD
eukprot:CAMPEP_0185199968 /NCGR_PEP_ID=MMETSP1140-20130426/46254_1 /TAXON_ID=298111 /ORGANISM="Pavlova sp., Strain CCMP459" /LENGTH=185 /DNA_ID=CAMNT_0027767269 /DNA_START=6 /DNA_END=566 /DNA_ORIENTATION=+